VETVERPGVGDQAGPLGLEDFHTVLSICSGCLLARAWARQLAASQALSSSRSAKVQPRRKQMLARVADLVLDLTFLSSPPPACMPPGPPGNASTSAKSAG